MSLQKTGVRACSELLATWLVSLSATWRELYMQGTANSSEDCKCDVLLAV
jgi:hypothetical protein